MRLRMARLVFITHPEVVVDPKVDVRRWGLTEVGAARMRVFSAHPDVAGVTAIWSSDETKATEAGAILSARLGVPVQIDEALGENDRSATGFLPPAEFERMADAFFARPNESVRGWERAVDAQARVRGAMDRVLARHDGGDVAVVAHGAVGSLLLSDFLGEPISRAADQPFQGHYWQAELPTRRIVHRWLPIAPRG